MSETNDAAQTRAPEPPPRPAAGSASQGSRAFISMPLVPDIDDSARIQPSRPLEISSQAQTPLTYSLYPLDDDIADQTGEDVELAPVEILPMSEFVDYNVEDLRKNYLKNLPQPQLPSPPPNLKTKSCPRCGAENEANASECDRCGIVFSKYKTQVETISNSQPDDVPQPLVKPATAHETRPVARNYVPLSRSAPAKPKTEPVAKDPGVIGSLNKIPSLFLYPLKGYGAIYLAGFSLLLFGARWMGFLGLVHFGLFMSIIMTVLRHASKGQEGWPSFTYGNFFETIFFPALRGIGAVTMIILPALLAGLLSSGLGLTTILGWLTTVSSDIGSFLTRGVLLLTFFTAGLLLYPAALIVAAINENFWHVVNPLVAVGIIRTIGKDYLLVAAMVYGLNAVNVAGKLGLFWLVNLEEGFFLQPILAQVIDLYFWLIIARLLGLMVFLNGYKLGILGQSE